MYLSLRNRKIVKRGNRSTRIRGWELTIVPYVIKPTRAFGGNKDKLTMMLSLSAFRSSSYKQVSTTYKKIGGVTAGRFKVYSIVVYFGRSSAGRLFEEMSL